jgi:signal transduction histidine kinase
MDNLLSNAIKYSKPGVQPRVNISSSLVSREDLPTSLNPLHPLYHCVEVKDNGVGFDQHYAHKIFDLFSRLHHEVKQPGTGVGLTICKKIVANHDGFITVNSTKGEGTSFFIYLPE